MQCHVMQYMENPICRNCSPGIPHVSSDEQHQRPVSSQTQKKDLNMDFPQCHCKHYHSGKKTLERKLAEVWFQSSHWIYILHGRRNVSINLSAVSSLDVLQDTGPLANISISHIHRVVNLFFSSCSLRIGAESATEQCSLQPGIWQLFVSDYSQQICPEISRLVILHSPSKLENASQEHMGIR